MEQDISAKRESLKQLYIYLVVGCKLSKAMGRTWAVSRIDNRLKMLCREAGVTSFDVSHGSDVDKLDSMEQCKLLEEACKQTFIHQYLEYTRKAAA